MTPASTEKFDFTQTMKNKINTNTESTTGSPKKTTSQEESPDRKRKTTPGFSSVSFGSVFSCLDSFLCLLLF
jgi:hypothetical protein